MKITYDVEKNAKNIRERGLSFDQVAAMEWETASVREVTKAQYRERRFRAWGLLDGKLHVVIYTPRDEALRVISFRKANSRERKKYEKETSESLFD